MSEIRVRRHTDGRAAICTSIGRPGWWWLAGGHGVSESYVTGPGWSELMVTELPEQDDDTSQRPLREA